MRPFPKVSAPHIFLLLPLQVKSYFFFMYLFIYFCPCWVFIAVHGCSLIMVSGGYSLVVVYRLPIAVASLVVEHGL